MREKAVLIFIATLEWYLKVNIGGAFYNLRNYKREQFTDTTVNKAPNSGGCPLQQRNIKCNDKNDSGNVQINSDQQKQIQQLENEERQPFSSIGTAFFYIETSGGN